MKTSLLFTTVLTATLVTGAAFADNDCNDSVADWQPKEILRQMIEAEGWKVNRIKVDGGCYEVKGFDQNGNKIKAEYFPASLRLRKLVMTFDKNAVIPNGIPSKDNRNNGDRS